MNILHISPEERTLITTILRVYLPTDASIWAFGSRITPNPRAYADLDLGIDAGGVALTLEQQALLRHAFEESVLPYRVDIVDLQTASPEFSEHIRTHGERFLF